MDPQVSESLMKNFLYNLLVLLGRLWVAFILLCIIALIVPVWIVLEVITYMEKLAKVRSNRALTEYID